MDLFEKAFQDQLDREAPLAARMRPRTLDEFVGQDHIVGPGRLLRRAIQADQLGSLVFYGPPGTGKTTLARVIANTTRAHFTALNAVLAGVKDIRAAIDGARERGAMSGQRTILFVDEVHRFNKAQQDALLPWVENGTVIFVGATTENPFFEVNKALVSRSRIFQLTALTPDHLRKIAAAALEDPRRGYGSRQVRIDKDALEHLVDVASGDARALLNAMELAVETTEPVDGEIRITLAVAEESIQRRAVLYDKEGDYHFDTISAFIKSLRGSDPDAALYWMAKMIHAGEPPRFIFRRMLILASEDVGLADPAALGVVVAAAQAFEQVGLPEGRFHLAQAALYLATCPKSNTTLSFFDALAAVEKEGDSGVPHHLRDANRDAEGFGHGEGYLYPHAYRDHWVAQQYLPTSLQGKVFYEPSDQGYEASIRRDVSRRREAQLAAMLSVEATTGGLVEVLTFSTRDAQTERWLQRTISSAGARLGALRDRIFDQAAVARHDRVLDLRAGAGLLTWEALRRAPEGGVWSLTRAGRESSALATQASRLARVERPVLLEGHPSLLGALLADDPVLRFDAIVGFNALLDLDDADGTFSSLVGRLAPGGRLVVADAVPRRTQRLCDLLDLGALSRDLERRARSVEESIYARGDDPLVAWDVEDRVNVWRSTGLTVQAETLPFPRELHVTPSVLGRWFDPSRTERPSFGDHLAKALDPQEILEVRKLFERKLLGETVTWGGTILVVSGTRE